LIKGDIENSGDIGGVCFTNKLLHDWKYKLAKENEKISGFP